MAGASDNYRALSRALLLAWLLLLPDNEVVPMGVLGVTQLFRFVKPPLPLLKGVGVAALFSAHGEYVANLVLSLGLVPMSRISLLGLRLGGGFAGGDDGNTADVLIGYDFRIEPPSQYSFGASLDAHIQGGSRALFTAGAYVASDL